MHDTASRCTRVRTLVTLGSVTALGPLSMDMYLPGLPDLTDGFGASTSAGQLTLAACLVGLGVGQLLLGPVSDACGRRRPLLASLVTYVLASALCAVAPTIWTLVALRLVQGIAGAGAIVVARAVVRDRYEGAAAARYYALLMLVTGAAPILAPVVGGQLLRWTSWRGVFGLLAGLGLLMVVLAAVLPETLPSSGRRTGGVRALGPMFRQVLSDRSFVGFALASGLAMAAMFAYLAGSPFVLQEQYGLSAQQFSLAFAANALGLVVLSQVSGLIVGRTGPRPLLAIGLGSMAAAGGGLALAVGYASAVGVLVAMFALVTSLGFVLPNAAALAMQGQASTAGAAAGLMGLGQFAIGAVATPAVGSGGADIAWTMAALVLLFNVAALAAFAFGDMTARVKAVDLSYASRSSDQVQRSAE